MVMTQYLIIIWLRGTSMLNHAGLSGSSVHGHPLDKVRDSPQIRLGRGRDAPQGTGVPHFLLYSENYQNMVNWYLNGRSSNIFPPAGISSHLHSPYSVRPRPAWCWPFGRGKRKGGMVSGREKGMRFSMSRFENNQCIQKRRRKTRG